MENSPKGLATAINETIEELVEAKLVKLTEDAVIARLQPGDILAVRIPKESGVHGAAHATKYLKRVMPAGTYCLIHHGGIDLAVIDTKNKAVFEAGE